MILFQSTFQGLPCHPVPPRFFSQGRPDQIVFRLAVRLEDPAERQKLGVETSLQVDGFLGQDTAAADDGPEEEKAGEVWEGAQKESL